jgi:hypothetical protein
LKYLVIEGVAVNVVGDQSLRCLCAAVLPKDASHTGRGRQRPKTR